MEATNEALRLIAQSLDLLRNSPFVTCPEIEQVIFLLTQAIDKLA